MNVRYWVTLSEEERMALQEMHRPSLAATGAGSSIWKRGISALCHTLEYCSYSIPANGKNACVADGPIVAESRTY
jgi:hypothetical protein